MKCNCGEIMQNSVLRTKEYGKMLGDVSRNKTEYKCSDEDLIWYKELLRDNNNAEKQFNKMIENSHIKNCK